MFTKVPRPHFTETEPDPQRDYVTKFILLTSSRPRIRTPPSGFLDRWSSFHLIPLHLWSAHSPLWLQTHEPCPANKKCFLSPIQHMAAESLLHMWPRLQLGYRATWSDTNRSHGGVGWGQFQFCLEGREAVAERKVVDLLTY